MGDEPLVTIVALTKYLDIWKVFRDSLAESVPVYVPRIVVVDGFEIKEKDAKGWKVIQGRHPFSMAHNHNIGWRAVNPEHDILNLNDDIYFTDKDVIPKFQELAYGLGSEDVGSICASAAPGSLFGNKLQMNPRQDRPLTFAKTSSNGCTYFKRDAIDHVGFYDEGFDLCYGAEDADYTHRINLAGFKVAISRDIKVKHGYDTFKSTSTIRRSHHLFRNDAETGIEYFKTKWGHFDVHGET